jgi:hypothetical protein
MGREQGRHLGRWAAFTAVALTAGPVAAWAAPGSKNVRLVHVGERAAVGRALDEAARQLAFSDCEGLLDEFKDTSGRPLRSDVEALGVTASQYLAQVFFYDAPPKVCETSTLALTRPGSRAVLVCGSEFVRQMRRSSRHAQAILIHEALHSLGLGENPPSSDFITDRVRARCQGR